MRKGTEDELIALKPPPEFQDSSPSPSGPLPPPTLFEDHQDFYNSSSTSTSNSTEGKPQLLHNSSRSNLRSSLPNILIEIEFDQDIRGYADKISLNIINEALLIARIIPPLALQAQYQAKAKAAKQQKSKQSAPASDL